MSYSHDTVWMNGRLVAVRDISEGRALSTSPFEKSTFDFIQQWLTGQHTFVLRTSGSTGAPKEISITRTQMEASARLSGRVLGLKENSNAFICIDTRYIGGKMMLVRSLLMNMRIAAVDPCACPFEKWPPDYCVNFTALVPYQVQMTLASGHSPLLNTVDTIIIGGSTLPEKAVGQLQHYLCRCYATYGMTETISHVALQLLNGEERNFFFEALPEISFSLDPRGCLVIHAPYLTEPVITNDLVDLKSDTEFLWLGRWDNVINSGGVKLIPEKIEQQFEKFLARSGHFNRFFVHGANDERFGQKLVLVLESVPSQHDTLVKIIEEASSQLHPYERPKEIWFISRFLFTETGKINRSQTLHLEKSTAHFSK